MTVPEELMRAVEAGAAAARAGRLVTFGITATRPETGFGYIEEGAPLAAAAGVLEAASFVEKPSAAVATAMLERGGFVWNSGMFLFRAAAMLAELETLAGDILAAVKAAMGPIGDGTVPLDRQAFAAVPSAPIDKAVMERSERVAVVPCAPGWSDVGSWHAVWEIAGRDPAGNALSGDAVVVGGRDNLVRGSGRLVALAGVDDLAVIDTPDALLVAPRSDAEAVKRLVGELAAAGRSETIRHRHEPMPWGLLTRLLERPGYTLRELSIDPAATLELTTDATTDIVWTVIAGTLELTTATGRQLHAAGATVHAERAATLRLANPGTQALLIVELARGGTVASGNPAQTSRTAT
jgi:mannose-1-phosphate guanylyltransferase/mannose-1-phosphate guanylyltransferase/mannose-6-phosphate isomerase